MKKTGSLIFFALCVIVTIASVANVFIVDPAVQQQAKQVACGGDDKCSLALTSETRTPIGQTLVFSGSKGPVTVGCRRAFIVFGDYQCSPK